MAYQPVTDFLALLRQTATGVRSERMPGLDFVILAMFRMGFMQLWVSPTAPTVNLTTTVWLKPASPSYVAEGQVYIYNTLTAVYEAATPALWSTFIASPFIGLIPAPATATPLMDGAAAIGVSVKYAREDHVHPTDASLAPLNSPVLIGNPTAPTQSIGDSSTKLATTAFVIANGGLPPPIGSVIAYAGTSAPSANWAICNGQAISRTTFAVLFALLGITFGSGDGTTTFNIPDLRGRVVAGVDGGANRLTTATMTSQALAGTGGTELRTLVTGNLPPYTPTGTNAPNAGGVNPLAVAAGSSGTQFTGNPGTNTYTVVNFNTLTVPFTGGAQGGSSTAFGIVQPTMELNQLMRVS